MAHRWESSIKERAEWIDFFRGRGVDLFFS